MKKTAIVAALLAACAANPVFAASNLGMINPTESKSFSGVIGAQDGADEVLFTLPTTGAHVGGLGASFSFNFSNFSFSPSAFSFKLNGNSIALTNNAFVTTLAGGQHKLEVFGTTGAQYVGGITNLANLAPVPEPESYAMLLAGLGVMGAVARRRRQNG